jgi:methionine-S-sulfoxide reductase
LLGAGCFWSKEYHLRQLKGVISTHVGFAGGTAPYPNYQQVCTKTTGHAEVVRVVYDTRVISLMDLLDFFSRLHDVSRDRSGGGGQYRSAVFFPGQQAEALELALAWKARTGGTAKVPTTEIKENIDFYPASGRHQQYCVTRNIQPPKKPD